MIMYFGFFAPLSYQSDRSKMRDAMQYQYDDDFMWLINDIGGFESVSGAIREALIRSVWMQGRLLYWTRRAVSEANGNPGLRGPGMISSLPGSCSATPSSHPIRSCTRTTVSQPSIRPELSVSGDVLASTS